MSQPVRQYSLEAEAERSALILAIHEEYGLSWQDQLRLTGLKLDRGITGPFMDDPAEPAYFITARGKEIVKV